MDVPRTLLAVLRPSAEGDDGFSAPPPTSKGGSGWPKTLKEWNGRIENQFMMPSAMETTLSETAAYDSMVMEAAAGALHARLVRTVSEDPSTFAASNNSGEGGSDGGSGVGCSAEQQDDDDEADEDASRAAAAVRASAVSDEDKSEVLVYVSDLLRACKNILRYTNQRRAATMQYRGQPNPAESEKLVSDDPTRRLRQPGVLSLYLALLEGCSVHFWPESIEISPRDGVAQTASLSLFHATFGIGDPVSDAARSVVIGSDVNFIPALARLMQGKHPLPLLISMMRHVHNLIGSDPTTAEKIDAALESCPRGAEEDGKKKGLYAVLVATLAWAVRSDPPFPGPDPGDRRADLAVEVMRIMFVLRSRGVPTPKPDVNGDDDDVMTQMGILICDILRLPNADFQAFDTKLAAVNLLMDCPPEYGEYLLVNGGIPPLLQVLHLQLTTVVVERTGSGSADAAAIVPILVALTRLSDGNADLRAKVREGVFPPDSEECFLDKAREERERMSGGGAGGVHAKNMSPLDAPRGTVRWKLIRLMTWTESNVKRCASELLWSLCDGDATEFVLRTGFGNAVHLLGIKGLVAMPKEPTIHM